jgi:D-beta-D-heptose 7-phosphate kinase/D-beta-D-heptose 1-phosphate adenosyltransferase
MVLVDPKGRDFSRYRGATLLTPNQREFEDVAGRASDDADLVKRAEALRQELDLEALIITRGERGMTLVQRNAPRSLHLPALMQEVYDVTGAGDTVLAALAAALVSGYPLARAAEFANAAAGQAVRKLGTAVVTAAELNAALAAMSPVRRGVLDPDELEAEVQRARQRGERIVFTNGCFDILHEGHVACLEYARAQGERLVVAVNDDASVSRLKGPGRPVNGLTERMRVLAALACVDWVTAFSEDTPEALIRRLSPEVLVKGGDYAPGEIAGADWVQARGGQVVIAPLVKGRSSSAVIDAAARSRNGQSP